MKHDDRPETDTERQRQLSDSDAKRGYAAPMLRYLGHMAHVTQKSGPGPDMGSWPSMN